jgi:RNA polymerase sigma-70 factor, ECF subfamily
VTFIASTPTLATDDELVEAIVRKREDALAEAYRRHARQCSVWRCGSPAIRRSPRKWSRRSSSDSGRILAKFDPSRGNLRSFLLAHSHGRSVDLIRSEAARRTREDKEARLVAEAGPSIDEEVIEMQMAEQVRVALATLHPQERSAIELAYFGGHSYREVAEMLGQPEGTVKSRIRAGLRRMHDQLRSVES